MVPEAVRAGLLGTTVSVHAGLGCFGDTEGQ